MLTYILDNLAPLKSFQVRKNYCYWLSKETKDLMRTRNQAQKLASQTQREEDWNSYRVLRNQVNNRRSFEKLDISRKSLNECSKNSKDTWKCVKDILSWSSNGGPLTQLVSYGSLLTKHADLIETMNSFLITKVHKTR